MRLSINFEAVQAAETRLVVDSLASGGLSFLAGIALLLISLRRPLDDLQKAARFAGDLDQSESGYLQVGSRLTEIQRLAEALNWTAICLSDERGRRSQSEARKQAITDSALDCIFTTDQNGLILEFNPSSERTLGYALLEVLQQPMIDLLVPPEYRARHQKAIDDFLAQRSDRIVNRRFRGEVLCRDGSRLPMEIAITSVAIPGGVLLTYFARDIRQQLAAQEALAASERRFRGWWKALPRWSSKPTPTSTGTT